MAIIQLLVDSANLSNLAFLSTAFIALKLGHAILIQKRALFSPLRHLKGPESHDVLSGNMKQFLPLGSQMLGEWMAQYGTTFRFCGPLLTYRLVTTDLRAIDFIMRQSSLFPKSDEVRNNLNDVLGKGVLLAEGSAHKRQRRVMNPAFVPNQIRELVPIFWDKSNKLRDILLDKIRKNPQDVATLDVLSWLGYATLDIIGSAGFDYDFNSLEGGESELGQAISVIFSGARRTTLSLVRDFIPILGILPDKRRKMVKESMATMQRIGREIIDEKKVVLSQELKTGIIAQSRDLLTLLIKANMTSENEHSRMTDEELLGQITTFFVAGQETTSTATTWALYALAKHPEVQRRLRQELLEAELGDEPSMDSLDKLPYLDKVVHETLRLHPAASNMSRKASQYVEVPVSSPFKDRYGALRDKISIAKDEVVFISIMSMNRLKEVWGEDAAEFRPDRWDNPPKSTQDMPGMWAHTMTFSSGSHSCVGFRFALIEMKALLYSLIRAIEFDVDPNLQFQDSATGANRPLIPSEPEKGNRMPLMCKAVSVAF